MDDNATELLSIDTTFRDEPILENLSDVADKTLDNAESMLKSTTCRDVEFLKTVLLELMLAEKRCRMARDGESTGRICKFVIQLLYDIRDFPNLIYYLVLLTRKRGQLKAAITAVVNHAMGWIPEIADMDIKMNLINTLSHITLGKMFLEVQRAELAYTLAKIREDAGEIDEAANIMHNVEIETFGVLPKTEKVRYLLEQMRLHLLNKDYLRFYITSKKIDERLLDANAHVDHLMKFYEYMVYYYLNSKDYFEVAKAYRHRLDCALKSGSDGWLMDLECLMLFLMIAPLSDETIKYRKDMLESEEKRIKDAPVLMWLYKELLSDNLIAFPLTDEVAHVVKSHAVFSNQKVSGGEERLATLDDRVIQHNIMVVSKFYTNLKLSRLSELTNIGCDKLEEEISAMVHANIVHAKIDRPSALIRFGERKDSDTLLNAWSKDIATLMGLVDQCSRLVQKEKMIHEARIKQVELENSFQDMPKNKGKGGKNRRRGKNDNEGEKRELVFKMEDQEYAQVLRMLGNGRLEAYCFDGNKRLCHIRGKMRKRVWVNAGDIILVSLRDYQDSKADVIAKYTPDEARSLKAYGELPESTKINETDLYDEEGDGGIEFQDDSSESGSEDGKDDAKFDIDDL
ncbi:26S proteasome non-ATPase regulatory subunit 12 [Babesia sp. Xinjiang]|uniref:26S proteasome non-ATPase regulatory subunit 12 n=1 Tax=Babesia sp. Xinjiang TaxID=462227 RepID=UPI000A21AAFB|nr:26S proteasome non-ATPase regulatory subunit 12 [Babesia sp. Xinjiang]XP_028872116.1 26S proteasome non-ATPase regulatory subunit 12 [Babesia sp. Xinjiang]ORM41567.1 26S proteasome non-ATPase regulatory subunit 12 [Babesia sp. Xinjiang]ORM41660.1 26S proteasome non-ATPase regulatory subunit 12 [Babesia sp. Xinjiang]